MLKLPDRDLIEKATANADWDLGNQILYDMCKHNFLHDSTGTIIAKTWLIGRSYAVALERRNTSDNLSNDDFYVNKIVPLFKESFVDDSLKALALIPEINNENVEKCLKLHFELMYKIKGITGLNKRSFCAKYLHFHLPDIFFIYDSRALGALIKIFLKYSIKNISQIPHNNDLEYLIFCRKCLHLIREIKETYGILLTNRKLDKVLLA